MNTVFFMLFSSTVQVRILKKKAKLAAMPVKTAEEIEAEKEERLRKKREYHRNYQREWQHKRKEKEDIDKIANEKVI